MSDTLKRIEHNPRQTHSLVLFDLHLICVRSKADTTISHQRKWHRLGSLLTAIRFAIVGTSDKSTGSLWGVFKMVWLRLPMKSPHQCCTIVQVALCHQCNVNKPFDIKPLWLHCSSDLCSSVMVSFFFYYYFMTNSKMGCKTAAFNASFSPQEAWQNDYTLTHQGWQLRPSLFLL